jgi:trans-aconitate methyltransferase
MDDNIHMTHSAPFSVQTWDTSRYAADGRFVATLASAVVDLLNPQPGERILDAGCGDGALTQQLAASGASLLGVDSSPTMLAAARARGLEVDEANLTALSYDAEFDAVFSNAALHWIPLAAQPALLAGIHCALRPGGRFVAEMGGLGNIAAIRTALSAVLAPLGLDSEALAASFYPSPLHYRTLLEAAGFTIQTIDLIPRPTPLPNGPEGMTRWLETFRNGVLDLIPDPAARQQALADTVTLLKPILQDALTQNWTADYVRLRFHATRATP